MENASKALIMAGEILIALLIISLLVYGYTNIRNVSKTEQGSIEVEQLVAFNKEYESYNRKLLRGVDVISIMNKAINNNTKYENESLYKITIEFSMDEELVYKKDGKTSSNFKFKVGENNKYTFSDYMNIVNDSDAFTDFKRRIFDCKEIRYNKESGRVNYMYFKERKMTNNEYEYGL